MNKNSDNITVESANETNETKTKAITILKKAGNVAKTAAGYAASGAIIVGTVGLLALKTAVYVKYLRS